MIYHKKNKLTLEIELRDFSVYYTQGAVDAAIAAMKEGKSEVMCEQAYQMAQSKPKFVHRNFFRDAETLASIKSAKAARKGELTRLADASK